MAESLSIVLGQLNPTVGDLDGNVDALLALWREAITLHLDLVVAPELYVSGYPPEDLVLRPGFHAAVKERVDRLARATLVGGTGILVGAPWVDGDKLHNSALLLHDGKVVDIRHKYELPNYGVFDERRVFVPGPLPRPMAFKGVNLGVLVCEDMWKPAATQALKASGAEMLVVINASPYDIDKQQERSATAALRVKESGLPMVYVNQVGGQDELVFDGDSFVLNADGTTAARAHSFRPDKIATRLTKAGGNWQCAPAAAANRYGELEAVYLALMTGLHDYVDKNGFQGVLIGFSGGIDSALTAAIAADALGGANARCVMLPSQFTSKASLDDAALCARNLGVPYATVPIAPAVDAFQGMLKGVFSGRASDTTEENIQARARAVTLMALSNKFGYLLLNTGNKSEMSVGYATLYGDMAGGFSVLKDVYKTVVYRLAAWRNTHLPDGAKGPAGAVIPESILKKDPTAELRLNQKDSDTLPPYVVLDDILRGLVEEELPFSKVVARGHKVATVIKVEAMLYGAEFKRQQAAPGVRVTRRAFGRDRRYPITNRFREAPSRDEQAHSTLRDARTPGNTPGGRK